MSENTDYNLYFLKIDSDQSNHSDLQNKFSTWTDSDGSEFAIVETHRLHEIKNQDIPLIKKNLNECKLQIVNRFPECILYAADPGAIAEVAAFAISKYGLETNKRLVYLGRNLDSPPPDAFSMDIAGGYRKYWWSIYLNKELVTVESLENRYSHLIEKFRDEDTKVVVSLSGGGMKAIAHGNLLRFFDSLGRHHIDEIWGTSGGSIAGLWYASGIRPQGVEQAVWDIYNKKYSIAHSPSKIKVLRNLLYHYCLPVNLKSSGISGFIESAKSIRHFIQSIQQDRKPDIPFYSIAFNLKTMRTEVLATIEEDLEHYKNFIRLADPIDATVASSCVPVIFVPESIQTDGCETFPFIDGGVVEPVPIKSLYAKWKMDRESGREKRSKLLVFVAKLSRDEFEPLDLKSHVSEIQMLKIYEEAMTKVAVKSQLSLLLQDEDVTVVNTTCPLEDIGPFEVALIPQMQKSGKLIIPGLDQAEALLRFNKPRLKMVG